ncbi:hypothetical protein [Candidatus Albibeggiatoa sp. nov. NOAA]|uniref:hypothetical protein n=1 Tax=Candidatus Albibeggiatoa sp. nov. NOAA TaxID=3162724 RepID=UPI0032FB40DA|nr:hypothetical protein [Thiotrichaceae bacterium]
MTHSEKIREVLITEIKFLAFRPAKPDLKNLGNYYLALGIITAWLAGVGRYWDSPKAELWQYLGLGSVAYIFILSIILWAFIAPLRPENWSYKSVLIFVGMTSPPAILYAIPVEQYFTLKIAQTMNVWFLVVVATWRVALLIRYLKYSAKLTGLAVFIATALPLAIIISTLTIMNIEQPVFQIMVGFGQEPIKQPNIAHVILWLITGISVIFSPSLLVGYIGLIIQRNKILSSAE